MIYCNNINVNPKLTRILLRAITYIDVAEALDYDRNEAIKYIEQDMLFVFSTKIPDPILDTHHIQFHFTDQ